MDGPFQDAPRLAGATLALPGRAAVGAVRVEGGLIAEITEGEGGPLTGDFLVPGAVDVHTDHVEKHLFPRTGIRWDPMAALLAHDAQIAAAGTTTVLDGLSVGASLRNPERREAVAPLMDALDRAADAGWLRADHHVHLRCEICDPETPALLDPLIGRARVRMASIMDHTPGDRQSPDVARWTRRMAEDLNLSPHEAEDRTRELLDRSARVSAGVRAHVAAAARARGVPLMSHDDATEAHVAQAQAEGATISEFPTTLAAARAARRRGMLIVAGAPNWLRGGSMSGNVAAAELLAEGLLDVLASDYVPRSLLDAAFAMAADPATPLDLPAAMRLVAAAPARAAGLDDRGEIAVGKRADLALVRRIGTGIWVRAVWVAGRRVA